MSDSMIVLFILFAGTECQPHNLFPSEEDISQSQNYDHHYLGQDIYSCFSPFTHSSHFLCLMLAYSLFYQSLFLFPFFSLAILCSQCVCVFKHLFVTSDLFPFYRFYNFFLSSASFPFRCFRILSSIFVSPIMTSLC